MQVNVIRVNCSVLIRLQTPDGRYALLGDPTNESNDLIGPISGVIRLTEDGMCQLCSRCQFDRQNFDGPELCFTMPVQHLPRFVSWLREPRGFEPNPAARIFRRELGPARHGLVSEMVVRQARFELVRTAVHMNARKQGRESFWTQYFFWIYTVILPGPVMEALVKIASRDTNRLVFVTRREIRIGRGDNGERIAGVSNLLL